MKDFVVFPALGYWEIDGKPVSSKEAVYGLHPRAIWRETEVSSNLTPRTLDAASPCDGCNFAHKGVCLLSECVE